jgi:hypothetical protein
VRRFDSSRGHSRPARRVAALREPPLSALDRLLGAKARVDECRDRLGQDGLDLRSAHLADERPDVFGLALDRRVAEEESRSLISRGIATAG